MVVLAAGQGDLPSYTDIWPTCECPAYIHGDTHVDCGAGSGRFPSLMLYSHVVIFAASGGETRISCVGFCHLSPACIEIIPHWQKM